MLKACKIYRKKVASAYFGRVYCCSFSLLATILGEHLSKMLSVLPLHFSACFLHAGILTGLLQMAGARGDGRTKVGQEYIRI